MVVFCWRSDWSCITHSAKSALRWWSTYFRNVRCYFFFNTKFFTDGLTFLSCRWMQPYQQHGRRWPDFISLCNLSRCFCLVSGFFTEIVQQIHSLRASGVRSSQISSSLGSAVRTAFMSAGKVWAWPVKDWLLGNFTEVIAMTTVTITTNVPRKRGSKSHGPKNSS